MKVTLNWLKEFIDVQVSAEELVKILTSLGFEVEEYYSPPRIFNRVVIGKVLSANHIASSDHLTFCQVDAGKDVVEVICGAPNVRPGLLAPLALEGATLAGEVIVKQRAIQGKTSYGMLCSESELDLTWRGDHLMELPGNAPIGMDLHEFLGDSDTLFDIFITPNRPDCLGVIGIAREIAAATGTKLIKPVSGIDFIPADLTKHISVHIQDSDKCYRYTGRLIQNLLILPSPFWMAERLFIVGVRSINNVVDVTNYVMMETGQPLHAFDYDLLEDQQILVRSAYPQEKFTTLDEKTHSLDEQSLLICDGKKAIALAGIMGGLNSEVSANTRNIFLESAYFEPKSTRRTAKRLDIATESSKRFEKGMDLENTVFALNRATELITRLGQGQVVGRIIDEFPHPVEPTTIRLSVENANNLLGTQLTREEMSNILQRLELPTSIASDGYLIVTAPSFRSDLKKPVDLVEEIARHHGYDNIPFSTAPKIDQNQTANPRITFRDQLRQFFSGAGFRETVTFNLVGPKLAEPFLEKGTELIQVINPLSPDLSVFRPNLIASLLGVVAYNRNRQNPNMAFFEIGNDAWKISDSQQIAEKIRVAGVCAGKKNDNEWSQKSPSFDFYDIKGVVFNLLKTFHIDAAIQDDAVESFWTDERAALRLNNHFIGSFGKLSRDILALYKIKVHDVYAFYLEFEALYALKPRKLRFKSIPKFPSVPFDLAIMVDASVPYQNVEKAIRNAGGPFLAEVQLFDFYKGEQIAAGTKSLAFSLTFSSKERTLAVEEVDSAVYTILEHLKKLFNAQLRPK